MKKSLKIAFGILCGISLFGINMWGISAINKPLLAKTKIDDLEDKGNGYNSNSIEEIEREALTPIENMYKVLDLKTKIKIEMSEKGSIDFNNDSIKKIIELIKSDDPDFNIDDYRLTYNIGNEEEGFGQIFITYYINGKIETNRCYVVSVDNNIVQDIVLGGVKKANLNKIKEINNNSLLNKVENFEKNTKKEAIYNKVNSLYGNKSKFSVNDVLTKDNKINIEKIVPNASKYEEEYYYDYNTNKLSYQLSLHWKSEIIIVNGEEVEITGGEPGFIEIIIE